MYADRPIFWPVFWAVFAALAAFNLLKWGVMALLAAGLLVSFGSAVKPTTTPGHLPARPGVVYQQPAQPEPVPRLPGPLSAVRDGLSRACIGGYEADRMDNGWKQLPNRPCTAISR